MITFPNKNFKGEPGKKIPETQEFESKEPWKKQAKTCTAGGYIGLQSLRKMPGNAMKPVLSKTHVGV